MTLGSMDNGEGRAAQLIQLEPLIHQVSGHSSLWVLDDVTVCKPLIGREAKFYKTLPPQMRGFTPEFRGTVKVVVHRSKEGMAVAAVPPSADRLHSNSVKVRRVGSNSAEEEEVEGATAAPPTHNPWLQQCHQRYLNKLKQKAPANILECILLENLTHVYRVPNVLDLKMGTRQYGDDASESKRRSQTRKAHNTTTPRLGVRLAGMQVYDRDTMCYVCKNKYVGRELSEDGFQQTLRHFLHNGRRFRTDILEQIICKLTDLRKVVDTLHSFRFFTSSLLILYDSYDAKGTTKPKDASGSRAKHTDQENRNKTRDTSEKASDCLDAQTDTLHNREKSKDTVQNDVYVRVSRQDNSDNIANGRDDQSCKQSNVPHDNSAKCASDECPTKQRHEPTLHRCSNTAHRGDTSLDSCEEEPSNPCQQRHNPDQHRHQSSQEDQQQSSTNTNCPVSSQNPEHPVTNKNLSSTSDNTSVPSARPEPASDAVSNSCSRTKVDIRLIDFAHATHKGMGDPTLYSGPDEGMMLGLKSLINIFTDIKNMYTK